jgi:hypothetical protein
LSSEVPDLTSWVYYFVVGTIIDDAYFYWVCPYHHIARCMAPYVQFDHINLTTACNLNLIPSDPSNAASSLAVQVHPQGLTSANTARVHVSQRHHQFIYSRVMATAHASVVENIISGVPATFLGEWIDIWLDSYPVGCLVSR